MTLEKPNLVGWCETNNGYMAIFECPCCHGKFRFHPQMKHFDLDQFDFYLEAYYISDGDSIWIGNAKELSDKLDEASRKNKVMKANAPDKVYLERILCSNEVYDTWKSQKTMSDDIEYIRTDAFVEKAVRRLEHYLDNSVWVSNDVGVREKEVIIEDFVKYLEGE